MLHRGDLQAALIHAVKSLKPDAIVLNKTCAAVTQTETFAQARFQDGTSAAAPLLIGADGIHSTVRAALFGPSKPEFTGCVAWRGLIPMERLPAHLHRLVGTTWLGPRGFVLHYPVRRGELMNFVSVVERDDWQVESWVVAGTTNELANDFSGWHADVQTLIKSIETPYKWALMVRGPMAQWSKGRVTLLGDACHPTLPFLGQGAVMAIEDAYIVAACIEKHFDDPANAFERYEEIRRDRTANVVRRAQENRAMAFEPRLADEDVVAEVVAMDWMKVRVRERLDWLYNYDATAIPI
jgi:salicylate hydroxylase